MFSDQWSFPSSKMLSVAVQSFSWNILQENKVLLKHRTNISRFSVLPDYRQYYWGSFFNKGRVSPRSDYTNTNLPSEFCKPYHEPRNWRKKFIKISEHVISFITLLAISREICTKSLTTIFVIIMKPSIFCMLWCLISLQDVHHTVCERSRTSLVSLK